MYANGVSHLVSKDDYSAVIEMMKWISYVPAKIGLSPPVTKIVDPIEREIEFYPPKGAYDPRVNLIEFNFILFYFILFYFINYL